MPKEVAAQTTGVVADTCIAAILTLAVQIRSLVQRERPTNNIIDKNMEKIKNKLVINISNTPLTVEQEKLLAHGPNYAIVPRELPIAQYVTAIEHACTKLEEGKAEEFRVQVKSAIQIDETT